MDRYEALKHAVKAHGATLDKCGKPYILHPIAVAEAIERGSPRPWEGSYQSYLDAVVIALLHDILEDTDYGPPLDTTEWWRLEKLTRRPAETYAAYIDRICDSWGAYGIGPIPMVVKLADLWHNLLPERQDCLPSKERASLEKRYLKARERIWEALGYEWWPEREGRS